MVLLASTYDQSRFFKAADLTQEKKLRIKQVTEESVGTGRDKEQKLVVWFTNDEHGLVLKKGNNRTIRAAFGDPVSGWVGKIIVLFPTQDEFRGKMVPVMRVRIPPPKQATGALAPLIERPQWAVWRWTKQGNNWQKPPFMATQPQRHASTKDSGTWADYTTALATVQAGQADGISYILTDDDPLAAIDLDHCRHVDTHSIDAWAQNFLEAGRHTYSEVTPSGAGCRIWGLANGAPLNRKFTLEIDGKEIAVELFRRTRKALTITGYKLDSIRELTSIDKVLDWGVIWGERRKAAAAAATLIDGDHFNSSGNGYS
jgi:hypothetical protein